MKQLLLTLIILLTGVSSASSQGVALETYARRLAVPSALGGSVRVSVDQASLRALSALKVPARRLPGMRVCVYFDNSQNARSGAGGALGRLNSIYPNLNGRVVYQNPFFKVMVGECIDRIEAARLLGVLKGTFPEAIIVNDAVSLGSVVVSSQELEVDPLLFDGESLIEGGQNSPGSLDSSDSSDSSGSSGPSGSYDSGSGYSSGSSGSHSGRTSDYSNSGDRYNSVTGQRNPQI